MNDMDITAPLSLPERVALPREPKARANANRLLLRRSISQLRRNC